MKNVHMCYIRVTEGKIENLKKEVSNGDKTTLIIKVSNEKRSQNK